jgi:alkylated DNA repair protein alkB family protein 1
MSFLQPPNRTNHKAIHGPTSDLFTAEKERKVLAEDENTPHSLNSRPNGCVSNGDAHRWSL